MTAEIPLEALQPCGLMGSWTVKIYAMYNKSENCQNGVFRTHCKTETQFFFFYFVKKFTDFFFFPF